MNGKKGFIEFIALICMFVVMGVILYKGCSIIDNKLKEPLETTETITEEKITPVEKPTILKTRCIEGFLEQQDATGNWTSVTYYDDFLEKDKMKRCNDD